MKSGYWLTRLFYLRGLGGLYVLIGLILYFQGAALIGPQGLTPVQKVTDQLQSQEQVWSVFVRYPSLLFYFNSDLIIHIMSGVLVILGGLLVMGRANGLLLLLLWFLQLSLVNGAGRFWSFGWETMMLEMTLLAVFFVHPWRWNLLSKKNFVPTYVSLFPLMWMMFRLMLGAGLIKVRGDACWLDFTCMDYHYQTQPNPHPLSYYYHHLPTWFHRFEIGMTHFYELLVPFLFLMPRWPRISGGVLIILFQMTLISTGNLAFLNWQTMILALIAFDDRFLSRFLFKKNKDRYQSLESLKPSTTQASVSLFVFTAVMILSYKPMMNMISPKQRMNESYDGYHLVNSYGLFGSITKNRNEVIVMGTTDSEITSQTQWQEYEFKCKPGKVSRRPCLITPYHLRLDWQMWFSAMRPKIGEPWLVELARKMLINDPVVDQLLAENPFSGQQAPKFIKMDLYRYEFTDRDSKDWWQREFLQNYLPPISLRNFQKQ
jgi:hypothetical protein